MAKLHEGCGKTFAALVREYSGDLHRIARRYTDDQDEVEDLVQETWVRVFLRRTLYRGDGELTAWIRRICRNVCITHWRARERRRAALRLAPVDAVLSEGDATRREGLQVDALALRVMGLFRALSSRQRAVLLMRVGHGYPVAVVASRLGCSEGTVKSDLHRASARLRAGLLASGCRAPVAAGGVRDDA